MDSSARETTRAVATGLVLVLAGACAPTHEVRLDASPPRTVPRGTVLEVELADAISSETSKTDDRFTGRVVAPVLVGGRVAIETGSEVIGKVVLAVPTGSLEGRPATLGVAITGLKGRNCPEIAVRARFCVASLGVPIDAEMNPFVLTASPNGTQVAIPRGSRLRVRLDAPVTLPAGV